MLSMPRGTDPLVMQRVARAFAKVEPADHRYLMVLHDHQANPPVHLSVKAESKHGVRLNPRKTDLHRWRETFAGQLRELGIDAEASRQAARGAYHNQEPLWRIKAREEGRLRSARAEGNAGVSARASRAQAREAWRRIAMVLANTESRDDQLLAVQIAEFVTGTPSRRDIATPQREVRRVAVQQQPKQDLQPARSTSPAKSRDGPEMER